MSRPASRGLGTLFVAALGIGIQLIGCGVTVEVEPERVPPLPAGVAPPAEGCAVPLPVTTGNAWIGSFSVYDAGQVVPRECPYRVVRLVVPSFYLDAGTVTNGCYEHCVLDGHCAPPAPAAPSPAGAPQPWDAAEFESYPAYVSTVQAGAFCAWRGGRLASWAELIRAEQGDDPTPGRASAVSTWVACAAQSFASAECAALVDSATEFSPVGAEPGDVGPFGHADLFTMEMTWMATRGGDTCAPYVPDDSIDPVSFGTDGPLAFSPHFQLYNHLAHVVVFPQVISSAVAFSAPEYRTVVRCAYDPMPP